MHHHDAGWDNGMPYRLADYTYSTVMEPEEDVSSFKQGRGARSTLCGFRSPAPYFRCSSSPGSRSFCVMPLARLVKWGASRCLRVSHVHIAIKRPRNHLQLLHSRELGSNQYRNQVSDRAQRRGILQVVYGPIASKLRYPGELNLILGFVFECTSIVLGMLLPLTWQRQI